MPSLGLQSVRRDRSKPRKGNCGAKWTTLSESDPSWPHSQKRLPGGEETWMRPWRARGCEEERKGIQGQEGLGGR